jgi:NADH-quinone oxidoreductase subunit G/NADP-reducing hydrogenase subunit HndD
MSKIKIKINNEEIVCNQGQSILDVARENDIYIPSLCHHPDFTVKANCRICVVEVKGKKTLQPACQLLVEEAMEIKTTTERVRSARKTNIELIFAEHIEKCPTCIWQVNCQLLELADRFKVEIKRFSDRKSKRKTYKFANAVEIDGSQCIDCRNCIDACNMQKINFLEIKGKGIDQEIVPVKDKKVDCIYCGQCAVHCPVGSAQEQSNWEEVEKLLKNKKKIMVAQFAPSIRASIGEEFGMPYGKIVTGQIVAALKKIGFNYVFDVNFGADITTVVEAGELLERIKEGGKLPMMTSCCPAWVKYVEFYHPELIPNLTTSRSPQIHNGGIIKTYWAKLAKIDPKDIVVVSIMPCTAKKFEAARPELKINSQQPVDLVLTNREFAWMMKKNNIDFANLDEIEADGPLGEYSGAAAVYGASGGVMESALRTAQSVICGDKEAELCHNRLDFTEVRGLQGIKEAEVVIADHKLRVVVVNGIGNIGPILEKINNYDYIEVMACPGGCIGGGGQPIPTTPAIRQKRMEALYKLDRSKTIRKAHEIPEVKKVLDWLHKQPALEHKILHTKYKRKERSNLVGLIDF